MQHPCYSISVSNRESQRIYTTAKEDLLCYLILKVVKSVLKFKKTPVM